MKNMNDLVLKTNEGWAIDRKGRTKPVDKIEITFPVDEKGILIQALSIDVPLASVVMSSAEMDELAARWCRQRGVNPNSY
jgi:hypothetical protein